MAKSQQELAIEKTSGPCMIEAGAGTGKTWTIVEKMAYLINNKVCKPSEILCLTFSNEATNSLKTQVSEKIKGVSDITIRTFHGFCFDILKEFGHKLNIDPGFDLLLPDDARIIMHKYFDITPYHADQYIQTISTSKDFGIDLKDIEKHVEEYRKEAEKILKTKNIEEAYRELDLESKTLHLKPGETVEERREVREEKKEIASKMKAYEKFERYSEFLEAWKKYNKMKKDKNYQDYSDLNFNVLRLFNTHGADEVSKRYKYVIVDEFQDTNKLQLELIEHLAIGHRNITVVGDRNQSIYAFRGAYRKSFDSFKELFGIKKTDIFYIDKSRRSPNSILRPAYMLIKNNYPDNPKDCLELLNFEDKEGKKVSVIELKNGDEEARKIAELVEEEIEGGTELKQICVMIRTHKQSRAIVQALESKKIRVAYAGNADLMSKAEIKTAVSYLSILNNLMNRTGTGEQAWWGIFHYQNALTPEDSMKIGRYLKKKRDDDVSIDLAVLTEASKIGLSDEGKKIMLRITEKLKELLKRSNKALPDMILDIYDITGLNRAFSHERTSRNVEAMMNLKLFYDVAENYYKTHDKDLGSFIKYIEILDDVGVTIPASKIADLNAVRVMTIHAVKGLQFDTVIMSNLADKRFPLTRTSKEPLIPKELIPDIKKHLEEFQDVSDEEVEEIIKEYERTSLLYEERRLCYVGMTRAKKKLIITYAKSYNKEEDSANPSIFLNEIDFKENSDIKFEIDDTEKCTLLAPCSKFEMYKSNLKKQLIDALDSEDMKHIMNRLILYNAVKKGEVEKIKFDGVISDEELRKHIKIEKGTSGVDFDRDNFTFSPTQLIDYNECPKKYELAHIFQMPQRGAFEWSGASTGSFVHNLFEYGVKNKFSKKDEFIKHAVKMSHESEWKGVDLNDVNSIVEVFWARNKGMYDAKSLVEQHFSFKLDGFKFYGIADRIDFLSDKKIRIVDYKTNSAPLSVKKRLWQLGFYAIAAKECLDLTAKQLVLDMLRLDKPVEMDAESDKFDLDGIKEEILDTARKIVSDYESEFKPADDDGPCYYCGYKFYCPKWND